MTTAVVGAMLMIATGVPAVANVTVTELALEDGGIQRVLYTSPADPRAALIMLPGGNGMVEFSPDGAFRQMGGSFLLRTLPLWQAEGFAIAVLTPPNGMSLLGYRHTPAYAAAIGQAVDFVRARSVSSSRRQPSFSTDEAIMDTPATERFVLFTQPG